MGKFLDKNGVTRLTSKIYSYVLGAFKKSSIQCGGVQIMDSTGTNILGSLYASNTESSFQATQNKPIWIGWRGGKRAIQIDNSGNIHIGNSTTVDNNYRVTIDGDLHVLGTILYDVPMATTAIELPAGTDISELGTPGWYKFEALTSASDYLGFPGSLTSSTDCILYVSPPTAGGYNLRVIFRRNRLSASDIWYSMVGKTWYKIDMKSITTKDSATT